MTDSALPPDAGSDPAPSDDKARCLRCRLPGPVDEEGFCDQCLREIDQACL